MNLGNVATFTGSSAGVKQVFRTVADNTVALASSSEAKTANFFSKKDKKDLGEKK